MVVKLASRAVRKALANRDSLVIQARTETPDVEVTRMLDAAVDVWYAELMETLGYPDGSDYSVVTPHCMAGSVWTPHGPVVWGDCHGMEDDHIVGLVNGVFGYLAEHDSGHDIVVDVVADTDYTPVIDYLYEQPGATALMLETQIAPVLTSRPDLIRLVPDGYLDLMVDWVTPAARTGRLVVVLGHVQFDASVDGVRDLARKVRDQGERLRLVAGDIESCDVHVAVLAMAHIRLVGGRPGIGNDERIRIADAQRQIARNTPAARGFVSIADTFNTFTVETDTYMPSLPKLAPPGRVQYLSDVVLDAFWYQILGDDHVARFDKSPPGLRSLGGGRWELHIGEPEDWLPPNDAATIRTHGRQLLAPLLIDRSEARARVRALWAKYPPRQDLTREWR